MQSVTLGQHLSLSAAAAVGMAHDGTISRGLSRECSTVGVHCYDPYLRWMADKNCPMAGDSENCTITTECRKIYTP